MLLNTVYDKEIVTLNILFGKRYIQSKVSVKINLF
jgi:hypothetical protein